jgi:hypothetical protein
LLGKREVLFLLGKHLTFANHVHELDAGQEAFGGVEGFETKHWFSEAFHCSMSLRHGVVQVFDLTNHNTDVRAVIDLRDRRFIGAALIHGHGFSNIVLAHGLDKETLCGSGIPVRGQQTVGRLALFVNGPIELFPDTLDLEVRLIHAPAVAN